MRKFELAMYQLSLKVNTGASRAADLHDSIDHIVVRFTEGADGLVSRAAGVLHDHVDVIRGNARLVLGGFIGGGGLGSNRLGTASSGGRGFTQSRLGFSHLLSFSLGHTLFRIIEPKLTEADELVGVISTDEDLRVVNHEDHAVTLLDSNAGNAWELFHANLGKSLAALLLTSVELGAIYSKFWRVKSMILLTLTFEGGHLFFVILDFYRHKNALLVN